MPAILYGGLFHALLLTFLHALIFLLDTPCFPLLHLPCTFTRKMQEMFLFLKAAYPLCSRKRAGEKEFALWTDKPLCSIVANRELTNDPKTNSLLSSSTLC